MLIGNHFYSYPFCAGLAARDCQAASFHPPPLQEDGIKLKDNLYNH